MAGATARIILILSLVLPAASACGEASAYTIREGETIFGIARKNGIPLDLLCSVNAIDNPGKVKAGTLIRLPAVYAVRKGDTLFGISRSFSIPLAKLLALNKLSESSQLRPGARIYLPPGSIDRGAVGGTQGESSRMAARTDSSSGTPGASPGTDDPSRRGVQQRTKEGLVWPHGGRREIWNGKISGMIFHGSRLDAILAAAGGEVKWVGPYWGYGKTILIKGTDGLMYMYAGNEDLLVNVGDRVAAGTEIAKLGVSPQGGGAVLYFSIQGKAGQFVDPEKYITQG